MATPIDQTSQESSYPFDVENVAEMSRLIKQSSMTTAQLGLFPAELDMAGKHAILDLGCGPGEWVMRVAKALPDVQVTGVDISQMMTEYARFTAQNQHIHNVDFCIMDIRHAIDFPDASFDIVHSRFLTSFLSTTTWPVFMRECFRVLRPGGVVMSTEFENVGISTSLSLTRYNALMIQALRKAGNCFTPEGEHIGITAVQPRLLQQAGFQDIQIEGFAGNYSTGMPSHDVMYDDLRTMLKLAQPFIARLGLASQEELDTLYERAMADIQMEDFCASGFLQRVRGTKPAYHLSETLSTQR